MSCRSRPAKIDKDTMDHDATREQLELAAVEPGGLDRLMAGDTPTAQAVAAHLAGCPACADEAARLQRAGAIIGQALRELPSPTLRDRTLAAIRAEGVPRPLPAAVAPADAVAAAVAAPAPAPVAAAAPVASAPLPVESPAPISLPARRRRPGAPLIGWAASVAAAVAISIVATWFLVGARVDGQLASQAESISALEEVTTAALTVTSQPDAEHVTLAGTASAALNGSLAYSPSTSELVVVATGLTPPPSDLEYRCWVEVGGTRQRVGKMFFSQGLAYWVGPAPAVSGLSSGATFGVSLVGAGSPSLDSAPVLLGQL
jgi:anti-sigma factor RsiW